ncbi:hypothetical protein Poli38472_004367 [Pythium oligandrum]|uniref:Protein kinase domain-containing protein n=1 Tax=Pythium oligandrum TaxID=41045 RepID=A0A8K1CA98_PYTOL|nr:hypothetical protein Poli38472_004367 [Pythium oligandrum]|eukprot:TMW59298.1 hypothetical protein Poli38472_004367 [Pythium oligandrum]
MKRSEEVPPRQSIIARACACMREAFTGVFAQREPQSPGFERVVDTEEVTTTRAYQGVRVDGLVDNESDWNLLESVFAGLRIPTKAVVVLRKLGYGSFGDVFLGHYNDREVIIKCAKAGYRQNAKDIDLFCQDIRLMATLEHLKITAFLGVSWDSPLSINVLAEYLSGGTLYTLLYKSQQTLLWSTEKLSIATDVIEALTYLHSKQPVVTHRNLSSRSVLLSNDGAAKLDVFKVQQRDPEPRLAAGMSSSVLWMAPEALIGEPWTEKADVYSFGVLLSELDTRQVPFSSLRDDSGMRQSLMRTIVMIVKRHLKAELSPDCPPELKELAELCMAYDPTDRPTAVQVATTLRTRAAPSLQTT